MTYGRWGTTTLLTLLVSGFFVTATALDARAGLAPPQAASATLKSPDDVLAYIAAHPEQVSLTAYPVARPEAGIFHHADRPQPLASTIKILVLHEYACQVAEGRLLATEKVSLEAVFGHVVGRDGGAAAHALADWRKRGVLDAEGRLPLDEVAHAMIRYSCNASTDYLIARVGRQSLDTLPARLGLTYEEAPFPLTGCALMVGNHTVQSASAVRRTAYEKLSRSQVANASYEWNRRLRSETDFQAREIAWLQAGGSKMPVVEQAQFYRIINPRGTTRGYARVMADIFRAETPTPAAQLMRRHLSWPMEFPGNREVFDAMGTKGGSLPGVLTGATYMKRKSKPEAMVVALFFQDLPEAKYDELGETFAQQKFEAQLHADPGFFETTRRRLKSI